MKFGGLLVALLALIGVVTTSLAQENVPADKILFLHCKWKDGNISLVKAQIRPGTLKTRPAPRGDIAVEIRAGENSSLWSTLIEEPGWQRLEYEDPAHPGQLQHKEVRLTETEFVVRVPYLPGAKRIAFSRVQKPATPGGQTKHSLLSDFALPATEESK